MAANGKPRTVSTGGLRLVDYEGGRVTVTIPYGDYANPKGPLSAWWNREGRHWVVSRQKHGKVLAWAEQNRVPVSERAAAFLATVPPDAESGLGLVDVDGEDLVIRFDYSPEVVEAVRLIPGRRFDKETLTWRAPHSSVTVVKAFAADHKLGVSPAALALPDFDLGGSPKITVHGRSFAIDFTYDAGLISEVREMPGCSWSPELRLWLVPMESVDEVLRFHSRHDARLSREARALVEDAASVQDAIAASSAADAEIEVPGFGGPGLSLMPFQRAGVAYGMRAMGWSFDGSGWVREPALVHPGGVLVGDEMGLGKTVQGLALVKATGAFPAVIVCPASLKLNWQREAERWIPGVTTAVLSGTTGEVPDAEIYICNYDVLEHWVDRLPAPQGVVLDESHYVKNGQAKRSRAAIRLSDRATGVATRVCLSGTPVVNAPLELMTQLRVIGRLDDLGGAGSFRREYGRSSPRALASLNRKLRATCYVRRRKADVLTELPPKAWAEVVVEGDKTTMAAYRKAEADVVKYLTEVAMKLAIESGADSEEARREAWQRALRARAAEHLVLIATLKRLAAQAKMKSAREWIGDFLDGDKKLVVFGWHTDTVNMVADGFADGLKIQGGMTAERRQAAVDSFQNDDASKVISCQIKAAGVGLTLTAASDVLFLEQGWTPADMDQAVDRCHRIGQRDSVTGWLMLAKDTIDEDIAALISAKRAVVDRATDGVTSDDGESSSMVGDLLVGLVERGLESDGGR